MLVYPRVILCCYPYWHRQLDIQISKHLTEHGPGTKLKMLEAVCTWKPTYWQTILQPKVDNYWTIGKPSGWIFYWQTMGIYPANLVQQWLLGSDLCVWEWSAGLFRPSKPEWHPGTLDTRTLELAVGSQSWASWNHTTQVKGQRHGISHLFKGIYRNTWGYRCGGVVLSIATVDDKGIQYRTNWYHFELVWGWFPKGIQHELL